jgi:drug/metabolite transporter (DMT)-like permease
MAYVILDESISLLQIAGSMLVLAGVLIISMGSQRERH